MAVIRNERKFRYTVVPNDPLRNADLTLQAKGLLALMLSYPDDWNYNLTHLEGQSKNKRDAHRNALRELIAAGYAEWRTVHGEDGTFQGRELVVTDVPFRREPENTSDGADRGTENAAHGEKRAQPRKARGSRHAHRGPEKPTVGKSDTTKTVNHEDPIDEEPPLPPQAVSAREEEEVIDVEATVLDLTAYQRRQATKPDSGYASSRLASFFPAAHKALIAFRRVHPRGVPDAQFSQWAQSVAEDVDEHGEAAVAAALQKAVDDFPSLRVPFRYYKTCLTPKAVAAAVKAGDEAAALMAHLQRRKAS